ncbi:hypothetical protein MBLNU459_g5787t1 [Dothideomycetes sp. NU459]
MYRRSDPRFRRTLNEISQTFETANESAQANIFTFSHKYVSPCFQSIGACLQSCTASCFPDREARTRRSRARSRGRAELNFDFYDDWDDEETDGLLGWGNDEFDRLASNSGGEAEARRKSALNALEGGPDPTIIPASSYFGFFGKLTGKIGGGKALRYKPSAADLQEHPGARKDKRRRDEDVSLVEEEEDSGVERGGKTHKRNRSMTAGSGGTVDSFSSRGDIFPSEDEDDAVPLDDEFAMVLERRTTGSGLEEASSGKARSGKRPSAGSRVSTRTTSSRSTRSSNSRKRQSRAASGSPSRDIIVDHEAKTIFSLTELRREEERIQTEEEAGVAQRREAAHRLAVKRGLSVSERSVSFIKTAIQRLKAESLLQSPSVEGKLDASSPLSEQAPQQPLVGEKILPPSVPPTHSEQAAPDGVTPFPAFDPPPMDDTSSVAPLHLQEPESTHESNNESSATGVSQDFVPAQLPRFS